MNAKQLMLKFAETAKCKSTPYCMAGMNGPYNDKETLVRNISHWLYTFSKCFEWTHNDLYKAEAIKLADALCSREARPYGFTFLYRDNPNKNRCNGLIGTAWAVEGLAEAGLTLSIDRYRETAKDIFLLYPQNDKTGLWHIVEIDGVILEQDITLNHQSWFAASGIKLIDDTSKGKIIAGRISTYLNNLSNNLSIGESGVINHLIISNGFYKRMKQWMWNRLYYTTALIHRSKHSFNFLPQFYRNNRQQRRYNQTIGYHVYNLCALAALKRAFPDIAFWHSRKLAKSIAFVGSPKFKREIENNEFAYPYNPVGFEAAYAISQFSNNNHDKIIQLLSMWINLQLEKCFCFESIRMVLNTTDPNTLNARMCEMARIDPVLLENITIN